MEKETAGIDNLIASRNNEKKIMKPIRIMSGPARGMSKWNQFSQF